MPKVKPDCGIELRCSLCPKNPNFSDVSHLLTHISSKGHLAHRFKLQIRAQGEQEARNRLADFDFWYTSNRLDALLSDRLATKNQKKGRKSRAFSSNVPIKRAVEPPRQALMNSDTFRAPIPQMHLWPTAESGMDGQADNWEPPAMYATPRARRHVPNFSLPESPSADNLDPLLNTPWKPEHDDNCSDKPTNLSDSAKLKGVLWPGMNLFDSATPEQKRMRNQRKDNTILTDMINTSKQVEPAEVSYHASGEFRASRDIFGPLSTESSPTRTPTPKKPRKSRKASLKDMSTNAPRLKTSRGRNPTRDFISPHKSSFSMPTAPQVFIQQAPTFNPLAAGRAFGFRFEPTLNEEEEFRMTVNDGIGDKKRAFSIFQDSPQDSPGRTESLLEDHHFDIPGSSTSQTDHFGDEKARQFHQQALGPFANQIETSGPTEASPTPVSRQSYRSSGKENVHPEVPSTRRTHSASHVYPTQVLYDSSLNPLYHHSGFSRAYIQSSYYTETRSPKYSNFNGDFRPINPLAGVQQNPMDSNDGYSM